MCGLIGYLGSEKQPVNLDKLNILGIMNETRGTDSCGLTMDGEILYGIDDLKVYRDFAAFYDMVPPSYTTGVIGHTRKATVGIHNEANAHPFGFGEFKVPGFKDPVFEFVGVHNGTLLNHTALANAKGISITKTITEVTEEIIKGKKKSSTLYKTVSKIDSEILLERLWRDKDYSVLSEYNGAAALIWQWINKPNVMYFYHGKSRRDEFDKEEVEERPLYYWKASNNSLYVSSIMESLYVIGGDEKSIGEFKHNTVYEVRNGNIDKAKLTTVDRNERWKSAAFGSGHRSNSCAANTNFHNARPRHNMGNPNRPYSAKPIRELGAAEQIKLNLEIPVDKGIIKEGYDFDPNLNKGLTVCKQLRYWRNGHLANGVFAYIPDHGFLYVGDTQKSGLNGLETISGKFFYDKILHSHKPSEKGIEYSVPFPSIPVEKTPLKYLHYMYEGIRMKTYVDWFNVKAQMESKNGIKFNIPALSISAAHPIIDIQEGHGRTAGVYYNGLLAEGSFNFLGSRKIYTFTAGEPKNIEYIPGLEPEELIASPKPPYSTLKDAAHFLEESAKVNGYVNLVELDLQKELMSLDVVLDELKATGDMHVRKVSDRIEDEIDKIIVDGFAATTVPDYALMRNKLDKYVSGSTRAEYATNLLKRLISLDNE